jgi:DNA-binding transcriptional ArsR family regulator
VRYVHSSPPPILPILRSRTQLEILAATYLGPTDVTIGELAERSGADRSSVVREVNRLVAAGILTRERVGRTGVIAPAEDLPWFDELRGILMKTAGPPMVLRELFEADPTIDAAYVFGSWAARHEGHRGEWPPDIDLVVIGDAVSPMAVRGAVADLEPLFGVEVNPIFATPTEWSSAEPGSFLAQIGAGPLVSVKDQDGEGV